MILPSFDAPLSSSPSPLGPAPLCNTNASSPSPPAPSPPPFTHHDNDTVNDNHESHVVMNASFARDGGGGGGGAGTLGDACENTVAEDEGRAPLLCIHKVKRG